MKWGNRRVMSTDSLPESDCRDWWFESAAAALRDQSNQRDARQAGLRAIAAGFLVANRRRAVGDGHRTDIRASPRPAVLVHVVGATAVDSPIHHDRWAAIAVVQAEHLSKDVPCSAFRHLRSETLMQVGSATNHARDSATKHDGSVRSSGPCQTQVESHRALDEDLIEPEQRGSRCDEAGAKVNATPCSASHKEEGRSPPELPIGQPDLLLLLSQEMKQVG